MMPNSVSIVTSLNGAICKNYKFILQINLGQRNSQLLLTVDASRWSAQVSHSEQWGSVGVYIDC